MLTPLDIQNKKLRRSFRGYNEAEVDEFLDQLTHDYEWLYLDNQRLKEKLEDALAGVERYKEMEQTIKDALLMAQKNADDLRENTRQEAELLLSKARQKATKTIKEAEENSGRLVSLAEERAHELVVEAEEKVKIILNEYRWLERELKVFLLKFRSFLNAQAGILDQQEQEILAPLKEAAASYLKKEVASEDDPVESAPEQS